MFLLVYYLPYYIIHIFYYYSLPPCENKQVMFLHPRVPPSACFYVGEITAWKVKDVGTEWDAIWRGYSLDFVIY